ncbi:RbsD/FucU domain-containing protein [Nonomuraea sp. NPDC050691]|uniref:RbsD/FucU domain-containing protein n=1 Tax=Nonomuraea sp. NPDC050691 TaxID=3155661 RepID=UPI0033DBD87F
MPRFLDLLDAVLDEVAVEGVPISEEIKQHSPEMLAAIEERFDRLGLTPEFVPHTAFKQATTGARAAVRSGEFTPYANVLLTAGVVY